MRTTWTLVVGLAACSVLGVLLWSDASWARPKNTYLQCKCTCRAEDELGKVHYGSTGGVWYTTSGYSCGLFHKCTVGSQQLEGIATDCTETEKSLIVRSPIAPGATMAPGGATIAPGGATALPK